MKHPRELHEDMLNAQDVERVDAQHDKLYVRSGQGNDVRRQKLV